MKREDMRQMCQEVAENCVAYHLRRTVRTVSQLYEENISHAGIHGTQFSLMVALYLAEVVPVSVLAEHLGMDRTTLTRNLQLLERDELAVSREGEDKRIKLVSLTAKGVKTLEKALPHWRAAQEAVLEKYGKGNWKQTLQDLKKMQDVIS